LRNAKNPFQIDQDVEIINQETPYQGIFTLERLQLRFRLFSGKMSQPCVREVFHRGQGVGVLLYNPWQDSVLLAEQFRIGAMNDKRSPWLVELVAGMCDQGEMPKATVLRESKEEAGVDLLALESIHQYWVSPGASSEYMHLYCACIDKSVSSEVTGIESEGENIHIKSFSFNEAMDALSNGLINNSQTIIALQWFSAHHARLKQAWRVLRSEDVK